MALETVRVNPSGSAGSATGTANSGGIIGLLMGIKIDYTSQHANTVVTIAEVGGLGRTLLTISTNNTDATYYPTTLNHDQVGAARSGAYGLYHLSGFPISVTVTLGSQVVDGVIVTLDYLPD